MAAGRGPPWDRNGAAGPIFVAQGRAPVPGTARRLAPPRSRGEPAPCPGLHLLDHQDYRIGTPVRRVVVLDQQPLLGERLLARPSPRTPPSGLGARRVPSPSARAVRAGRPSPRRRPAAAF